MLELGEIVLRHKDDVDVDEEEWMELKKSLAALLDTRDSLEYALRDFDLDEDEQAAGPG